MFHDRGCHGYNRAMSGPGRKPGAVFWATVMVVAGLLYPLSFGPACWITSRAHFGRTTMPIAYCPVLWAMSLDGRIRRGFDEYARFGTPAKDNWQWINWSSSGWAWESRPGP